MKDTVLKKQFQEKDIKRMRNLIKGEGDKATQISDVPEEKPEIITIPMGGATGGGQGVSAPPQKSSNALPTINFDTNNPHTLYATSVTGAGN